MLELKLRNNISELHWFNPENEITLALRSANYTPSKAVGEVRDAGAMLPLWYGRNGDAVMASQVQPQWVEKIRSNFNIDIKVVADKGLKGRYMPSPWGWSHYACAKFKRAGVPADCLPSEESLNHLYRLSSRSLGASVVSDFNHANSAVTLGRTASVCTNAAQVADALNELHGEAYLKIDYSSSGRGVMRVADFTPEHIMKVVTEAEAKGLKIFVEPSYERAFEFALLFEYDNACDGYKFLSTSVFTTDSRGTYTGNLLAAESVRRAKVAEYIGERADAVREGLERLLTRHYAECYRGVIGVDMLVATDGTLALMEINMRKTMGYVANRFHDLHMMPGATGSFSTVVSKDGKQLEDDYTCKDGKLVSGQLLLSPPTEHFSYSATITD